MNKKMRSSVVGFAALYMIYTAYELFRDRNLPDTTMAPWVSILFAALFALAGTGLAVYSLIAWRQANTEEKNKRESDISIK